MMYGHTYGKITTTLLLTLALTACQKDAPPTTAPDDATAAPDGSTAPDESNEPSEDASAGEGPAEEEETAP